jgi:purine-binding chemotaxis protein CheW
MVNQLVMFTLSRQRYALRLPVVQQVVRMVEITPLPKAPEIVRGVVNLRGNIIPVFSVRKRFGLPEDEPNLSDQLIIANTATRTVALVVDSVNDVVEQRADEIVETTTIVPGAKYVEGIAKLEDGILFIHDLDRFLSSEEENRLHELLAKPKGK